MIKNESLGDRLTNFKNKEQEQLLEEPQKQTGIPHIISMINSLITLVVIIIKSFVFGYGLMTVFNADWKFIGYFCVGLAFNFFLEFILDLIALLVTKE